MKCCVDGCGNDAKYKTKQLCQKHYFRFCRNGTTDIVRKSGRECLDSHGYVVVYSPKHPLATKRGLIRKHRLVAYRKYANTDLSCCLCGKDLNWSNVHIDHIDKVKTNNEPENLRTLCRACNVMRTHITKKKHQQKGCHAITYNGITLTAAEWSRTKGVSVGGSTIIRRLSVGWSVYDALYTPSKTHPNSKNKKVYPKYRNHYEQLDCGLELD